MIAEAQARRLAQSPQPLQDASQRGSSVPVPEGDWDFDFVEGSALPTEPFNVFGTHFPDRALMATSMQSSSSQPSAMFHGMVASTAGAMPMTPMSDYTPSVVGECDHAETTKAGSKAYYTRLRVTCLSCKKVLELTKKEPKAAMETKEPGECQHSRKSFQGTTATTWKWTCKDCGKVESGHKNPGETGAYGSASPPPEQARRVQHGTGKEAEEIVELMRTAGVPVTPQLMDIIYSKCRDLAFRSGFRSSSTI